jgi:hypothetical protein
MFRRIARIAPFALAGWRFYQSRQRRNGAQTSARGSGNPPSTTPPQSYR